MDTVIGMQCLATGDDIEKPEVMAVVMYRAEGADSGVLTAIDIDVVKGAKTISITLTRDKDGDLFRGLSYSCVEAFVGE